MRPDIVASFKIKVPDKSSFDSDYMVEDFRAFKGVRDVAVVDLPQHNAFALDVRFHGQTEHEFATETAERIHRMLRRDSTLESVEYSGLLGHEDPEPGLEWTGRDPFEQVVQNHGGQWWVRADYFVHALSMEDIGIRDANLEHLIIEGLQRWPQRLQAREAIRRLREMYALLDELRNVANMPVPEVDDAVAEDNPEVEPVAPLAAAVPE